MNKEKVINSEIKLGKLFRKRREEMAMEIEHISSYLKVKSSDIEAIENEQWHLINKHLYKIGLIRSYARILKIENLEIEQQLRLLPFESNIKNRKHRLYNISGELDLAPGHDMFFNFILISLLAFLILLSIYNTLENKTHILSNEFIIKQMEKIQNLQEYSISLNS